MVDWAVAEFAPNPEKMSSDFSQCCVCRPGDNQGHYCDIHVPVESVEDVAALAQRLQDLLLTPPPMFKLNPAQLDKMRESITSGARMRDRIAYQATSEADPVF